MSSIDSHTGTEHLLAPTVCCAGLPRQVQAVMSYECILPFCQQLRQADEFQTPKSRRRSQKLRRRGRSSEAGTASSTLQQIHLPLLLCQEFLLAEIGQLKMPLSLVYFNFGFIYFTCLPRQSPPKAAQNAEIKCMKSITITIPQMLRAQNLSDTGT